MAKKNQEPEKNIPESDEEGNGVVGTGNDARLKMLAQINDANDRELAKSGDLKDVNEDGSSSEFAMDEGDKTDEEIIQEELGRAEEEANDQTDQEDETPPVKHKIKVNGRELELTTEELIERAQKVESADEYLQRAKEQASTNRIPQSTPQPSAEDVAEKERERKRNIVRAIQMGTEEEAIAALDQLDSGRTPSSKEREDEIGRVVESRIVFDRAVEKFNSEFPDLVADQRLMDIVIQRDRDLLAQGDRRDYSVRYREIGNEVRAWRDSLVKAASKSAEPEKQTQSDKQQRKASTPAVPKGAGATAPKATEEEDREESTGEIIASMAKARGGPQWLRG